MTEQPTPAGADATSSEPLTKRRPLSVPSAAPDVDLLSTALLKWAGKHDATQTAAALRAELRTRGIETVEQFLGSNPTVIVTALQIALRQDAVSLINIVAHVKPEQE